MLSPPAKPGEDTESALPYWPRGGTVLRWHRAFCLPQASKRSQKSYDVQEIDISQQPGALQEYGVMTTPSLAINGRLEFSGVSKAKKLIKRLKKMQRHTS